MSRYYGMNFEVEGIARREIPLVRGAIRGVWSIESQDDTGGNDRESIVSYSAYGESSLAGGEDEEEFATRAAHAIWKALGHYAFVSVDATYLEDLPTESYSRGEDDYAEFVKEQA